MEIIAKVDELGKGAWIGIMVLSFIVYWPIGLALLFFLIWSGRIGMRSWIDDDGHLHRRWRERCRRQARRWHRGRHSSGNMAFDEYRDETLRRLEEEQQEFNDFLDRLRHAKDRAEFEQFMDERRRNRTTDDDEAAGSEEPAPAG